MSTHSSSSLENAISRLRTHLTQVPRHLANQPATELADKAPGKWSKKEILGHLIDSAINNLKRFTDAQFADGTYQLQGYDQNRLVAINQYQELPLAHLITLWESLNRQIIYVVEAIPTETLARPVQVNSPNPADHTLAWLIEDYVAHLEHHLKTVLY